MCYDTRQHSVNPKTLLYPEMNECCGPALIVHNDAMFTDDDFKNITRLAATTKRDKPLKIGKFGVGFCSVYHITDVPCFVSQRYLYIFDPTLQYLKKHIKDKSRPGKRLNFTQKIATLSNQLTPFVGLYGFQTKTPFGGTIFRFPFRTSESDISKIRYTEDHIKQLMKDIHECGPKLLLFLQSVRRITFSRIDEGDETPRVLLDISKETLPPLSDETYRLCIHTTCGNNKAVSSHWLVGTYTEKIDFGGRESDAISSVACCMETSTEPSESEQFSAVPICGEVFCFLPLSVKSGLPVHVSANFSVQNDRMGIRSSEEHSANANEAEWNIDLMKHIIPKAYLSLLLCLSKKYTEGYLKEGYTCYSLLPLKNVLTVHNPWDFLVPPVYRFASDFRLLFSPYLRSWLTVSESMFLSPDILHTTPDGPQSVHDCVQLLNLPVVNLPHDYEVHLPLHHTLQEMDFVRIFFQRVDELKSNYTIRNKLIQLIMLTYCHNKRALLKEILQENECVPCTPHGQLLNLCSNVIDQRAFFADLYDPNDGVFPIKEFQEFPIYQVLIELGMVSNTLPLSMVAEQALTVQALHSSNDKYQTCQRAQIILRCVSSQSDVITQFQYLKRLKTIPFIPVLERPLNYPGFLSWDGDNHTLLAPNQIYCGELCGWLAGSTVCVACTDDPENGGCGDIERVVMNKLGIRDRPEVPHVVNHFQHLIEEVSSKGENCHNPEWVTRLCSVIYQFFEDHLSRNTLLDISSLENCVWTGSNFVTPDVVALHWVKNGPYLFQIPGILEDKRQLVATLGIKGQFSVYTYIETLEKIRDEYLCKPVDRDHQELLVVLLTMLSLRMEEEKRVDWRDLNCYLPDTNLVMKRATALEYNDANWQIEDESGAAFVHHSISRDTAIKLGVRPIRAKILDEYEDTYYEGEEFGQSEELTQRIKNILEDYPLDMTVLKELLQNADDAKANKMLVILDKRTHGKSRVPSDEWSDLQGPALLVWNDSTFHKEDMEGIQKLGLGSKRSESETIGMYGIGFNVVYHLTDCPSFISTEKDGESTLCILDPHCRYIPGARKQKPGRRFNNLDQKFWRQWSDMGSAYLRSDELSENIKCGSLFRFPLRHSQELIAKSELVTGLREPLDAERMETYLKKWAPHMKETLFFLNNVTELQFFVIDDDGTVFQTQHYKVNIDDVGQQCRTHMQEYVHRFSTTNATPLIKHYVLTLVAKEEGQQEKEPERWLIQQGLGDIENPEQHWHYLPQMKPKHGIASPLCVSEQSNRNMHVFCFLPLPIRSHLPVHINGSFVLHSSRRQLWQPTTSYIDDKAKWNLKLIEAIASSYAHLLATFQDIFISAGTKNDPQLLMESIESYYKTFPVWLSHSGQEPEGECLALAKSVYQKLHQNNASVLVHLREQDGSVNFLPLMNKQEPWNQPYFYERQREGLNPILRKIGMQLTEAPLFVYKHFLQLEVELSKVTQQDVFKYYSQYHSRHTGSFKPALISETMFETVEEFKEFTKFILIENENRHLVFPELPFNIPLLLTADGFLRMFDLNSKGIRTQFTDLFPNSKHWFLHPEMMDVNYIKDYFLKPQQQCWDVVHSIMSRKLPVDLQCPVVTHATTHLNHDTLTEIWKCFGTEEFFHVHLKRVIQTWALIPSTSKELFSLKCHFLPIMEHSQSMLGYQSTPKDIFRILGNLGMPQVDITVVQEQLAERFCPKLSDAATVVKNLFHLHQERTVLRKVASTVVEPLLQYCGTIHLAYDQQSLSTVKKLPLFRSIDGHLCSIQNGAYIWPENTCDEGKDLWLQEDGPVFLDAEGEWTCLNASILGITKISPFTLYSLYIFPVFYKLQEKQRMRHLEVIRDSLFDRAEHTAKDEWMSNYAAAVEFIKWLKKLHFIPRSDQAFRPVHEFADPRKKIFKTFEQHFQFPPSSLQGDKWLDFFVRIGLRTNITTQEYLQFCHDVNLGKHSNLTTASHALIDYLFTEKEWHSNTNFLVNVSKIAFVCAESLPGVTWIHPYAESEKVVQQSSSTVHLTSLAKATDYEHYSLIWTVKPVVRLPSHPEYSHDSVRQKRKELLSALRIYTITAEDVVRNIQNISRTKFSDFQNFETYSCGRKPKDGCDLLEVLEKCYEFLKDHCTVDLSPLIDISCMPVCADGGIDEVTYPVLVKPIQVIALASDSLQEFMPFLTRLPKKFYSILPSILAEIGVEQAVMLKHVQSALETIHKCIDQELDVNSQRAVKSLIRKLYELLHSQQKFESIRFRVLYLPNSKNTLVDSRTLLYKDCEHFRKTTLSFEGSRYSELHLLVPKRDFSSQYKFSEKDLCNLLPPEIAPKPLTTSCREIMSDSCQLEAMPSQLAKDLSKACKLPRMALAACAILKHNSNPPEICKKIRISLEQFFENCEVFTVKRLTVDLRLEIDQHKIIGTAEVDFHIKKTDSTFCLYINKEARKIFFFENLSMAILSQAAEMCSVSVSIIKEPRAALTHLLKAETSDDIMRTLREMGASDVDMGEEGGFTKEEFDPFLNPVLSDPLPESWHHRLQQDYNNLFRPGELVGYEREEDCIVLASIGYKIAGEYEGFAQYCIYLEDDEHKKHIVSVLDIYKIHRSAVVRRTTVNTKEMAVYEGHKETHEEATDIPKSLTDVKKEICEELRKIWKLPEELKRKAIKRMYLKWHPDKNPDNPDLAEEAFKFLKRQIDRLEHGDSMDDPDAPEEEQGRAQHQDFTSHFWESFFRTWDHTAHSHSRYQQSEWRWQSSGFSRTTTDHDQWSDFNFGFQDTTTPDIVKAQKWMRQAECDYEALSVLSDHICPKICANICFLAHEVAEKSLKAGMLAVWGLRPKDFTNHKKMIDFALNLEQKRPQLSLYEHVISLPTEEYYYKTRWPNMYGSQHKIPAENFNEEKAYNAKDAAFAILGMIKSIIME